MMNGCIALHLNGSVQITGISSFSCRSMIHLPTTVIIVPLCLTQTLVQLIAAAPEGHQESIDS